MGELVRESFNGPSRTNASVLRISPDSEIATAFFPLHIDLPHLST
jgi:hypothetical protein